VAKDWHYLPEAPKVRMLREPGKIPRYVTGDDFAILYAGCDKALLPDDIPNVLAADWWRALLVMGYMTGWRIGDMLALRRDNLDLDAGTACSLAEDNKGKRDEVVKLHPVVVDHLRKIVGFDRHVFPWNCHERTLWTQFAMIQEKAGIKRPYGFHDLRRAFATMNADKLTADALQALMRHKSYQTTQRYINMARQMDAAVAGLHVPEVLKRPMEG
jgi:integrase